MLDQGKGLMLQPATGISRHGLLVSLQNPLAPGSASAALSPALKSNLNPQITTEHSRDREEISKILLLYSAAVFLLCA